MISLIIPLYNEAEGLVELHARITRVLASCAEAYEIVFVDDGSSDNSWEVITRLHQADPFVRGIALRRNFGKAEALACGFGAARGDILVTLDADLQDQPEEIPRFLDTLNQGYDLVSGWKQPRLDPFLNVLGSRLFNYVASLIFRARFHDINCGFKAYRREVLENTHFYGELYRFLPLIIHQQGFKVTEVVVSHQPRKYGRSKYGPAKFVYGFIDLLTVLLLTKYARKPAHFFGTLGIASFLGGLGICLYLTVLWFMGRGIGNRPLFFLGILLLIIGIQLISLGLLGEMLAKQERKKNFSIRQTL